MTKPEADIIQDEHDASKNARKVILVDTNGVEYNAAGGGGSTDGAILDGVSSTIKATVLDYTNSNPLAVRLTDTTGDYVAAGGGGEQYKDNTAVNADYKGTIALGTDGSNYQVLAVDSSGNLQVDILNSSLAVTGTFWQATQPVSLVSVPTHAVSQSGTWLVNGEVIWDYVGLAQDSTHDTYTFKTGGAGGTTVQTITITYTDSTKATISNVVKS